jgi:hypothetical protein
MGEDAVEAEAGGRNFLPLALAVGAGILIGVAIGVNLGAKLMGYAGAVEVVAPVTGKKPCGCDEHDPPVATTAPAGNSSNATTTVPWVNMPPLKESPDA